MLDKQILDTIDTLNTLANVANSEATTLSQKTDKASQDKAKALYAKQSQFATLATHIRQFPDLIVSISETITHDMAYLSDAAEVAIESAHDGLQHLIGLKHPDPKLNLAVYHPATEQLLNVANNNMQSLKRNAQLRKQCYDSLKKEHDLIEKGTEQEQEQKEKAFQATYHEYTELSEKDAQLANLIKAKNFAAIDESNRRLAQFLKQKYNMNDLPEVAEPKAAPAKTSAAMQWGKGFFGAITDMFKALNDPKNTDTTGSVMKVIGTLIQLIFNGVGSLFKKFLGNGKQAQEQVDDFTNNATQFFTNLIGNSAESSCQPGKPCARPGAASTFTPGFAGAKKAAPGLHQPAPAVTPAPAQEQAKGSRWNPLNWFG